MDSEKFEHPRRSTRAPSIALALLAPIVAVAHVGQGDIGAGLIAGVEHPIFGFDHVVAMVAVGIWGAVLGPPAIWVLPVTFPLVMAFGGVLGRLGVPIPGVEIGIAASAIVLGSMVAFAARPPLWIAAALVGAFAIFHGYAHGAETARFREPDCIRHRVRRRDWQPPRIRHLARRCQPLARRQEAVASGRRVYRRPRRLFSDHALRRSLTSGRSLGVIGCCVTRDIPHFLHTSCIRPPPGSWQPND